MNIDKQLFIMDLRRKYVKFYVRSFCLFLSLTSTAHLFAQELLSGEHWIEKNSLYNVKGKPSSYEEARKLLLEEIQQYVSGMVYGYSFSYTPEDTLRNIKEKLQLSIRALIPWGDTDFSITEIRIVKGKLYAGFRYFLEDFQSSRREAWLSSAIPIVEATGEAPISLGYEGRAGAFRKAVIAVIRKYLRPRHHAKPKEIRGKILLDEFPSFSLLSGTYKAVIRVKLHVESIEPYRVF